MRNEYFNNYLFKIGEVLEIVGHNIKVKLDADKNASHLVYNGKIISNIAVDSFIEIRKDFLSIIGKIEGEIAKWDDENHKILYRLLQVKLVGYIDSKANFKGGILDLPLVGNVAYIITEDINQKIYNFADVDGKDLLISGIAESSNGLSIDIPINNLFNSHIAIFGNTGSGKSNTLASLYSGLFKKVKPKIAELQHKFIVFDFNGEYTGDDCLSSNKTVYNCPDNKNKIPIPKDFILQLDILALISDATEKTQVPFIKRVLETYSNKINDTDKYVKLLINNICVNARFEKNYFFLIMGYIVEICSLLGKEVALDKFEYGAEYNVGVLYDGEKLEGQNKDKFKNDTIYQVSYNIADLSIIAQLLCFFYLQLIEDILDNRTQNDHIIPCINKLKSRQKDIDALFEVQQNDTNTIWGDTFLAIINLTNLNIDIKKLVPMILAKQLYKQHKDADKDKNKILTFIIDEAHNILSKQSYREDKEYKDYRLEVFEEIIKEGRKFGVFITIASQRPSDISETIISQIHNYFVHRLINSQDLHIMTTSVSYIDKVTVGSIPSLATGNCIFSGTVTEIPLRIKFKELSEEEKPQSKTRDFI